MQIWALEISFSIFFSHGPLCQTRQGSDGSMEEQCTHGAAQPIDQHAIVIYLSNMRHASRMLNLDGGGVSVFGATIEESGSARALSRHVGRVGEELNREYVACTNRLVIFFKRRLDRPGGRESGNFDEGYPCACPYRKYIGCRSACG